MTADIVRHLASAGRMADQNQIVQVELFDELGKVIGILVHVVAVPRLIRLAVAAAVVSDDTVSVLAKEQHLRLPGVAGERPSMRKEDRLSLSPVLVGDLGSVFGRDEGHAFGSLCLSYGFGGGLSGSPDWEEQRRRGRRAAPAARAVRREIQLPLSLSCFGFMMFSLS